MYYNMAVSTMVVKLQLKENIKCKMQYNNTHQMCLSKPKTKYEEVSPGLNSGQLAPGPTDCWSLLPWPDQWWWAGLGCWPGRCPGGS